MSRLSRGRPIVLMATALLVALAVLLGSVGTITAASVVATVTVKTQPYGVACNPTTNKIYVANYGSNSVSVINGATDTVIGSPITVGTNPKGVGVNPTTNKIYVANYGSNSVSVINGATDTVIGSPIKVGVWPEGVGVNPTTNKIYVANHFSNTVSVINGATDTVIGSITVGPLPTGIGVNPTTNKIYVANFGNKTVSVIDGATDTVTGSPISVGPLPLGVGVNPATNKIYVSNFGTNTVTVIDGATDTVAGSPITVGTSPFGIGVNPTTNMIYVANYSSGSVSVIDGATGTGSPVTVGSNPAGVCVNPATYKAYVANYSDKTVSVLYDPFVPIITGISPNHKTAGGTDFTLTVDGKNFLPTSVVNWNGSDRATSFVSATEVTASILASDIVSPGGASVTVTNPDPGGGTSNAKAFTIYPNPHIDSINPSSGPVNKWVHITGTGFGTGGASSYVTFFNVQNATTKNWTDTGIDALVPAGAQTGNVTVTTLGGTSNGVAFTVKATLPPPKPSITKLSPTSGTVGSTILIYGHNFGGSRGSSYVKFRSKKVATYYSWSSTKIKVKVPSGATTGLVKVTTPVGTSNGKTFTVTESKSKKLGAAPFTWYLAEGSTNYGFDCYITIENPNGSAVTAKVTYMTGSGPVTAPDVKLPAGSQATINPRDKLGNQDFSTKVVCKEGKAIAVDRTMSWTGPGAASPEAHSSIGVTSPSKTWYLPEGSSQWGFECWLLIQNPNSKEASCDVTYMIEGEGPKTVNHKVPANSRKTFNMKDDIGEADASIMVEGNIPVIPERAMYRNNRREGHDSIGTTSPASDFYLAEGTSAWGFTTYVLIQNPNPDPTDVTVTYMTGAGPKPQAPFTMPANSRKTIRVNDITGMESVDFSTQVHGSKPIIAERAMYWDKGTGEACHDSVGMDSAHTTFYLPDGQSSDGRETWTLVQNPNSTPVTVLIIYLTPTGKGDVGFEDTIGANSRMTYNMEDKYIGRAAVMVMSKTKGKRIMVERAMYWNNRGAGTDTIGGYSD